MTERLSRERIAALRGFISLGLADSADRGMRVTADKWRDLLAALDAYEAQLPRPASEPPGAMGWYIAEIERADPAGDWRRWDQIYWNGTRWGLQPASFDAVVRWLPLPTAPEVDDG